MNLITVGLNHRTAPLAIREGLAFSTATDRSAALQRLAQWNGVREAALLSTCNRTELYTVTPQTGDDTGLRRWLCEDRGLDSDSLAPHFYVHRDRESVRHTLRVAAGLDSMVIGETQILGQMKQAFREAQAARTAGPTLTRLFEHSFTVAKKVRSETEIGAHAISVAYAGVGLARRIFEDFSSLTAMLIGAGDTIELTARHLAEAGTQRMIFANRSLDRAQRLAGQYQGFAIPNEDIGVHLAEADIVVASTAAPEYMIHLSQLRQALKARRRKPIFALDLAVPRDIEPAAGELEDLYLYTVDDLQSVVRQNLRSRERAAAIADELIDGRIDEFLAWQESRRAVATISALRHNAEAQRAAVQKRAERMLAQGKDPQEVLEFLAHSLTNKLLHAPTTALRKSRGRQQQQVVSSLRDIYRLDDSDS
ncbi:MAG: glutamyl-tRNA reductase [Salinisphaeraceae bacterium]|jgi:glutamyl-tRNA reductase|nr:glutamyl-tRNA reductase [Salinisphaeraceae bacterium]